jgi:ABC-type phosphate transport system substrate-binding protein
MRRKSSIRLALSAAGSVVALAAIVPGASQASYFEAANTGICKGADNVFALGASTQRSALLDGWGATLGQPSPGGPNALGFGYDASLDYADCGVFKTPADGGTKSINYRATGSGSCIDAVGAKSANDPRNYVEGVAPNQTTTSNISFCGSDDPPTEQQIAWAEQGPPVHSADGQLLTIPVAQIAVGVQVRLPDGCQVADSSKRQLSRDQINLAFEGVSSTWGDLFGTNMTADGTVAGLTGAQCRAKQFTRVVRFDSSGTTFVFKRYLQAASHAAGGDNFDWRDPSEGGTLGNTQWPAGNTPTTTANANGAGAQLDTLSALGANGGIGYADVATARSKGYAWDQAGSGYVANDTKLWVRSQRIADDSYISPAISNARVTSGSNAGANCVNVQYANQVTSTNLGASWFNTTAVPTPTDYPICALTYQLAWMWGQDPQHGFAKVQSGSTEGEFRATKDFLRYELGVIRPGIGQGKLATLGYQKLPTDVLATAKNQVNQIGWLRASTDPLPGDPITPAP